MSKIKTPQDRLKEYKGDIEKTQNAECQLLDIQRYSDREMTIAKIENRIKGYKQALEDVRKHTRYQLNVLQTMRITRDADIEVRMIAKDIMQILTIPEEE